MFTGTDYFTVAEHLEAEASSSQSPEAMYRAAISRYYYASYLIARSKLFKPKEWRDHSLSGHSSVLKRLKKEQSTVGEWYLQLKMLREHSDYHLWQPRHLSAYSSDIVCNCHCWKSDASDTAKYAHDLATWIIGFLTEKK